MSLAVSAPGKLVLLGDYAVLDGAPAISMAVNRRATVRLQPQAGRDCTVWAPEVHPDRLSFAIDGTGMPDWTRAGADSAKLKLVDEVLQGLAHERRSADHGFALQLDTSAFFDAVGAERPKLGLGSSAALTVALASALLVHAGHGDAIDDRPAWLEQLLALHRRFQGGVGSGIDVATSLFGGVLSYQLSSDGGRSRAQRISLPDALQMRFIWSGRSAHTPSFLGTMRAWREGHDAEYRARIERLTAIASDALLAASNNDAAAFIVGARDYAADLRALGVASGVDIYSAEHAAIAAHVGAFPGLVYKPCGAGGGDVGVVFATDPERLAALEAQLAAAGFASVPLAVDPTGLRLTLTEKEEA